MLRARDSRSCGLVGSLCRVLLAAACGHAYPQAPSPHPTTAADDAEFKRAMTALNTGDAATAEPLLKQLRIRHPQNFEINESLGLLYASVGELDAAVPLLEAATREQPGAAVAHANLGTAYLKQNHTERAANELQRAAELAPGNAQTQSALGQAWMLEKQPCRAIGAFMAARAGDSSNADLIYNSALAQYDCGEPGAAAASLTAMPGLETSAPAQSLLGDADEAQKLYKEAAEHYLLAAQIAPSEPNLYVLGIDLLRHWSFDPAIQEFEHGVKLFPDSRRMLVGEGIADYGAGQYDDAIRVFSRLLDEDGDNALYGEIFGRACTVLTVSEDPVCARLVALAQQHPRNANLALYAATEILHKPADPQATLLAQTLLHGALKADPELAEAHYELGMLLQTGGKWPESIAEMRAAIKLQPDYARAHYRLGLAYAHAGQKEDAAREMALDRADSEQKQNDLNARMRQITTLLVKMR